VVIGQRIALVSKPGFEIAVGGGESVPAIALLVGPVVGLPEAFDVASDESARVVILPALAEETREVRFPGAGFAEDDDHGRGAGHEVIDGADRLDAGYVCPLAPVPSEVLECLHVAGVEGCPGCLAAFGADDLTAGGEITSAPRSTRGLVP